MRPYIDLVSRLLVEAPIASTELRGDPETGAPFDQGTSYAAVDRKILQAPKGMAKIVRAFRRTPYVFEVFFLNVQEVMDGEDPKHNDGVDDWAADFGGVFHEEKHGVAPKDGVIRVVLLSNLSPVHAKKPISGWTLAHKIGHSIQDQASNQRWKDVVRVPLVNRLNELLWRLGDPHERHNAERIIHPRAVSFNYQSASITDRLTMGSARKGGAVLDNGFEIFAEVFAQYLISGKVTLRNLDPEHQFLEDEINKVIREILDTCVGCVMVEV